MLIQNIDHNKHKTINFFCSQLFSFYFCVFHNTNNKALNFLLKHPTLFCCQIFISLHSDFGYAIYVLISIYFPIVFFKVICIIFRIFTSIYIQISSLSTLTPFVQKFTQKLSIFHVFVYKSNVKNTEWSQPYIIHSEAAELHIKDVWFLFGQCHGKLYKGRIRLTAHCNF